MMNPSDLINFFVMLALYSFPNCLISILFGQYFWGIHRSPLDGKAVWFALIQTITGSAAVYFLPFSVHVIYFPCHFAVLYFIFFRSLRKVELILSVITALLCYMTIESLGATLAYAITSEQAAMNYTYVFAMTASPFWLIVLFLALRFRRRRSYPGQRLLQAVMNRTQKQIAALFTLLFLFNMMLIVLLSYLTPSFSEHDFWYIILFFICIAGTALITLLTLRLAATIRDQAVQDTQMQYIDDMNRLLTTIRGQRHDFMNHLQVVYSMAQCNKFDELKNYISQMFNETSQMSELLDLGHPAFAALLQSKLFEAESRAIRVRHSLNGINLVPMGKLSVDLIRIAANLIDNALDEAETMPVEQRWVEIKSYVAEDAFHLIVNNAGKTMSQQTMQKLFAAGYSTKDGKKHSGLGLAIVTELVQSYQGTIRVMNLELQGVSFHVVLPLPNI